MTKDELISKLRASGEEAASKIRAVPDNAWDQGRYENGWNARQILAHVASIEWTYPRLLDVARQPPDTQPTSVEQATGQLEQHDAAASAPNVRRTAPSETTAPTRTMSGGVNSYNDRQVEKRSGASIAELIAEFEKNRAATIAAFESADDALFSANIRSAGGITGTLADVVNAVAIEHVRGHVADIAGRRIGS